jgi:carboxypeptidase family protein
MRKVFAIALTFIVAAIGTGVGLLAAGSGRQQQSTTGGIQGVARDAQQQNLPGVRIQVRASNGQLVATGTTNSGGAFSFAGLNSGTYTIEVLDAAGNIVGTSALVAVTAGATATITVTAAAAGAIAAAGAGGVTLFGLGTIGTVAVVGAAAAATIVAVRATKNDSSPSR